MLLNFFSVHAWRGFALFPLRSLKIEELDQQSSFIWEASEWDISRRIKADGVLKLWIWMSHVKIMSTFFWRLPSIKIPLEQKESMVVSVVVLHK